MELQKLLPRWGRKVSFSERNEQEEEERLEACYQQYENIFSQEKVALWKTLSQGTWLESRKQSILQEFKGPAFSKIGTISGGNVLHLNRFESLFLLEYGKLILFRKDEKIPMTLQQAYSEMLDSPQFPIFPLVYRVFSILKKWGFFIRFCEDVELWTELAPNFHMQVFSPKKEFKRTKPMVPDHLVVVAGRDDEFPSIECLEKLSMAANDTPVLFALVDSHFNVSFYSLHLLKNVS